jgi:hypothetical protein
LLQVRPCTVKLGLKLGDIHFGEYLPDFDQISLVDENIDYPSGIFDRDVDFIGFDPTIAGGDPLRKP